MDHVGSEHLLNHYITNAYQSDGRSPDAVVVCDRPTRSLSSLLQAIAEYSHVTMCLNSPLADLSISCSVPSRFGPRSYYSRVATIHTIQH